MLQAPVTTRYTPAAARPFSFSYSKLKNFEQCPRRHYHIDVVPKGHPDKIVEEQSEQLRYGDTIHRILDQYVGHGTPLPPVHEPHLAPWISRVFTFKGTDVRHHGAVVSAEQQLAINRDFAPCEWFGRDAWYRAKVDVMWRLGPVAGIIDWKTGKIVEDSPQLMLAAAVAFCHYPELQVIRSTFAWLKEDATTDVDIKREELPTLWSSLWDRIELLRHAHDTMSYPPTPNRLCRNWCPVKQCPHNGEAHG